MAFKRLSSKQLAEWLRRQGDESWWSIDGDPSLMERISMPAPGSEVAEVLERENRSLRLLETGEEAHDPMRESAHDPIDQFAIDQGGERVLLLAWEDTGPTGASKWLLVEDLDSARINASLSP